MIRTFLTALAALAALPVSAQVVSHPTPLADTDGDGVITINKAITSPRVARGTDLIACAYPPAPPSWYAVKGTDCATAPVVTPPATDPFAVLNERRDWWGVNISGLEFASELSVKEADIDFYADAGVKSIRLPIKRDRLTTEAKLVALDAIVKRGTDRGILMVLDEHSYGNIGDPRVRDFWLRVGPRYKGQPLVAFDLQNEPNGGTWASWGPDSRDLIHALRAAGIDNLLILEWRQSSGAARADKNEASTKACESALCSLNRAGVMSLADLDPLKRTWLSPHRYFDKDGSGTSAYCRTDLSPNGALGSSVSLARKFGAKLYLGEFAWGRYSDTFPSSCQNLAPVMIQFLKNTPEFVGGASWGWGPRWSKSYTFRGEHPSDKARTWTSINGRLTQSLWQ